VNETDIIKKQLATERLHFADVASAFLSMIEQAGVSRANFDSGGGFAQACRDYFDFALTRFEGSARSDLTGRFEDAKGTRAATDRLTADRWLSFLAAFKAESNRRFAALDALSARAVLVAEWRAVSKIDADTIFRERALYERVKAALPAGVTLTSAPPTAS
jgi:hypothetical protein